MSAARVTRRPGSFAPVPEAALQPGVYTPLVFVVEWDIPSNSAAHRARFYRALRKLREEYRVDHEIAGAMNGNTCDKTPGKTAPLSRFSTMSVLITEDPELAADVFSLAKAFGRAHIYEGKQLE